MSAPFHAVTMAVNYRNKPQQTHSVQPPRVRSSPCEDCKEGFSVFTPQESTSHWLSAELQPRRTRQSGGKSHLVINFFKGILNYLSGATKPDLESVNCV